MAIDGADEERRSGDKRLSLLTTALNSCGRSKQVLVESDMELDGAGKSANL